MASIGSLVVDLTASTGKFETDLGRAAKAASKRSAEISDAFAKLGTRIAVAGAAAATALAAMAKAAIDNADDLRDMSQATGVSVESLSQLQYAAKLSGTSLEDITTSFRKLSSSAVDAANGVKAPAAAFKQLGISVTDAGGKIKGTEDLLLDVATVFSQYEDGAGKASIAQDLFGKSGAALIPFLNQGREGIEALKNEADSLGITLSQKTADAADKFNDSLTRLKGGFTGLSAQLAEKALPLLNKIADALNGALAAGDVSRFADQIATGFKLIVDVGYSVYKTFDNIGTALGALGAAAVAFATGNFRQAAEIIKQANADQIESEKKSNEFLQSLWADRADTVSVSANAAADAVVAADVKVKKTFLFGGQEKKSALQEVQITVAKIDSTPMEKFYEELNEQTKTQDEKALSSFYAQREALKAVWETGTLSAEQYNARLSEIQDELLPEFEVTAKKVTEVVEKQTDLLNEFQKEAARNTQDIIADTLENGFKGGIDGILKSFGDMIVKLTAQAVAADLAGRLFGSAGGGTGTGSGWIGALAGLFGGGRATGGPVNAGTMYRVNEREPEYFKPNVGGKVVPLSKMSGGGAPITNHFTIQAPQGTVSRQTEMQIAAAASRSLAQASRRNN